MRDVAERVGDGVQSAAIAVSIAGHIAKCVRLKNLLTNLVVAVAGGKTHAVNYFCQVQFVVSIGFRSAVGIGNFGRALQRVPSIRHRQPALVGVRLNQAIRVGVAVGGKANSDLLCEKTIRAVDVRRYQPARQRGAG